MYVEFAVASEQLLFERQQASPNPKTMGRSWTPRAQLMGLTPTRPPGWMAQPTGLSSWVALHARVANLDGARRKSAPAPAREALWQKVKALIQKVQHLPRILTDTRVETDLLQGLSELDHSSDQLHQGHRLKKTVKQIESTIFRSSRARFKDWIANSLKSGAGALHKYTKQYGAQRPQLAAVLNEQGELVADALQVVEAEASYWGPFGELPPARQSLRHGGPSSRRRCPEDAAVGAAGVPGVADPPPAALRS